MKFRTYCFALLALFLSSNVSAHFISGSISETDELAFDPSQGNFFYDLFNLSVDTEMFIDIFLNPQDTDLFAPYLAVWAGDFTPSPNWFSPPPMTATGSGIVDESLFIRFNALPGINYQIMASTFFFNNSDGTPADLGDYFLWATNIPQDDVGVNFGTEPFLFPMQVSSPTTVLLLGLGLMLIFSARRSRV